MLYFPNRIEFPNKIEFLTLKIIFVLVISVDHDEMLRFMWHFIWVLTVCKNTCLGFFLLTN